MPKASRTPAGTRGGSEPAPGRPTMPESYQVCGLTSGRLLAWSQVEKQLASARNYWVGTTRPDGRPHVMPVWGLWLNGSFYFSSDRRSRKARNLVANPALVVHLESGDDVVILEGTGSEVTDKELLKSVDDAYFKKYRIRPTTIPGDVGLYACKPRVAFAWRERDFNRSATRWLLGGHPASQERARRKPGS